MTTRRKFIQQASIAALSTAGLALPLRAVAKTAADQLPRRTVPGKGVALPVIGLGNSQAFRTSNLETSNKLLAIYRQFGGSFIDAGFSSGPFLSALARQSGFRDELFLGYYINHPVERPSDQPAETHSIDAQARALVQANGGEMLDLVQSADLAGYAANAEEYMALKRSGLTRFVGVARHRQQYHADMVRLIEAGKVDFVQVNYSMLEPEAEETVLPAAQAHGVGIIINRPFLNGEWFGIVKGRELPPWAADFDCTSWAQFSLKFILSHPAVTCVLTETAKEHHARDNLAGGLGRMPDPETRQRMKALVDSFA